MKKQVKIKKGNRTIASSVDYIEDHAGKGIGMMFKSEGKMVLVANNEGILDTSIHTFFCKPLLVAWINSKNTIVDIRKTKPFWFYSSKKPAKYIFETTSMNTKINVGDKIKFEEI